MQYQLRISGLHYEALKHHLFHDDGNEAIAIALCGRYNGTSLHLLLVHDLVYIPYNECERSPDFVRWKTERIIPLIEKAAKNNMAILKIHSHPGGYSRFSSQDDSSDNNLFQSVFGWIDSDLPHASAIMLPGGTIFGRVIQADLSVTELSKVSVIGDKIQNWLYGSVKYDREIHKRTSQAFGEGTLQLLSSMKIGVVGCSGTGSPVIEQLHRLSIGELLLVDADKVEMKNLNRIIASKTSDATGDRLKVEVLKDYIEEAGLGTKVSIFALNIYDNLECLKELAQCDIIFGCVDSIDGRDLLNRLAAYYLIPYFDLGVKLDADLTGGINKIVGTVNYIQPGFSSLLSRGLYDAEELKSAGLYRINPVQFPELVKNSYIKNVAVSRPAVISVNMMLASYAVNEFLNRIHPYKVEPARDFAQSTIDLTEGCFIHTSEDKLNVDDFLRLKIGLGDRKIFLDMIDLIRYETSKIPA